MKYLAGAMALIITIAIGGWITTQMEHQVKPTETYPLKINKKYEMAVWIWEPIESIDANQLAQGLKNEGITTIYLNVNSYTDLLELPPGNERSTRLAAYWDRLRVIVGVMKEQGIQVQALAGHHDWGNDSHWYLVDYVLDLVRDFNKANPDSPIAGVQLDIEPYGQAGWEADKNEYVRMYGEMVGLMSKRMQREMPGLQFGLAVPAWYATNKIKDKTILEIILNNLGEYDNYLAVMDYRNYTEGKDGSVALIKPTFKTINSRALPVRIIIGQEVSKAELEKVTFYGKSKATVTTAMKKLKEEYGQENSFSGFAINSWQSYQQLGR